MKQSTARRRREAVKKEVIDYLTDYGYDPLTAKYETGIWAENGLKALSDTPRRDIRAALKEIGYYLTKQV
jgi:hypothetical protein